MSKINWDVVWSVLRTSLVAGGPVGTLLIALDFPPVSVGKWLGIALALVGVLSFVVPGIVGALKQTDQGKANSIEKLDPEGKAAVLDKLPDQTKLAAVNALPDVQAVIVKDTATDGVAIAAHDPLLEKVVTETHAQVH